MRLPLNSAVNNLQLSGIRQFTNLAKQTEGCILLTLGEPEFDTPQHICEAAIQSLQAGDTHYPPNNGQEYLLQALSAYEKKNSLFYEPEEIIVTCGATEALFMAFMGILEQGDEVIIPTPAFGLYESIITLCRGVYRSLDTRQSQFQIDSEQLRGMVTPKTKAIVLTSPNNPTGCVYNKQSFDIVAEISEKTGIYIICDDVYSQLVYDDQFTRFVSSYPHLRENIIVVNSFSKPYAMTGWRLGWLMADKSVKQQLQKIHQYNVVSVNSFVQEACVKALDTDVSFMRSTYSRRRDFVYQRLCEMGLEVNYPKGAFYAFPNIQKFGMSSEEFCTRLIEEGKVALVPGSCFGAQGYVRLSYCCADKILEEGLQRLEKFLSNL